MNIWKSKTGNPLGRREFFARLRKIGFKRSALQMTRTATTYRHEIADIMLTLPKSHMQSVIVTAPRQPVLTGIYTTGQARWGKQIEPELMEAHDCANLLEIMVKIMWLEVGEARI